MKVILEISKKIIESYPSHIGDDFMDKIKLTPRYGGHINQNLCYEIEIDFPEEINSIRLKGVSK